MEKRRDGTIEHNTLPLVGRERNTLSVTDGCLERGGDGTIMRLGAAEWLVNIAHSWNFVLASTIVGAERFRILDIDSAGGG
jgi:hypothetical protein